MSTASAPPDNINPLVVPPPPTAIPAYGTQVQVLTSGAGITPETYVSIAGVGDITGPSAQVAEVDTTSHSTGSPHRTLIPTLIDDGQLSFPMYWQPSDPTQDPASPFSLQALFENRTVTKFQIINTDSKPRKRTLQGFVKQLNETYPVAGLCTLAVIIRITGAPVEVP
jgi:hypothetical protein